MLPLFVWQAGALVVGKREVVVLMFMFLSTLTTSQSAVEFGCDVSSPSVLSSMRGVRGAISTAIARHESRFFQPVRDSVELPVGYPRIFPFYSLYYFVPAYIDIPMLQFLNFAYADRGVF